MLSRKNFEKSRSVVGILVLFIAIFRQIFFKCFALILSVSPITMHLVGTFSIMRA